MTPNRTVVVVTDDRTSFCILVQAEPAQIGEWFRKAAPASPETFRAGRLAPDLIAEANASDTIVELLAGMWAVSGQYDHFISISRDWVFVLNGQERLFVGSPKAFIVWAESIRLVGKTVQFVYDGGSTPGGTRTVVVQNVKVCGNGHITFDGVDTAKVSFDRPQQGTLVLKDGWRRYCSDKIRGSIKVIA